MDVPRSNAMPLLSRGSCLVITSYTGINGEARVYAGLSVPIERERYLRLNRMDYLGSNGRAERKYTGT